MPQLPRTLCGGRPRITTSPQTVPQQLLRDGVAEARDAAADVSVVSFMPLAAAPPAHARRVHVGRHGVVHGLYTAVPWITGVLATLFAPYHVRGRHVNKRVAPGVRRRACRRPRRGSPRRGRRLPRRLRRRPRGHAGRVRDGAHRCSAIHATRCVLLHRERLTQERAQRDLDRYAPRA